MTTIAETNADPHRLARLFLEGFAHPDRNALVWWRETFYAWKGDRYFPLSNEYIRCKLNLAIKREFDRIAAETPVNPEKPAPTVAQVTGKLINDVIFAIKAITHLADFVEPPQWLAGPHVDADDQSRVFIPLRNGVLDLRTWSEESPSVLLPHTPNWFCFNCLPIDYNPLSECHRWASFLQTNLCSDHELSQLLCEWFGYCLTPDTSMQKFLMLEGEGNNGKSVICAALVALLGGSNTAHVGLERFGDRFSLHQTLGKLANIASEVGDLDRVAEGHLKAFTSGDRMTFDRKGKQPVEAYPTARLILATNNRPRISDRSAGVWRRMLIVPLTYTVPNEERIYGMDKAPYWASEASGMLNWALLGLADLRRYKRFTEPEACKLAKADYQDEVNPAKVFLSENYEFVGTQNYWVPNSEIYQNYRKWCEALGYQPLNCRNVGKEINRLWPKTKRIQRRAGTERFWVTEGIKQIGEFQTAFNEFT